MTQLPNWMRPHPEDRVFGGNERVGDNLCSRCLQPIIERETPIIFFANCGEKTWRYHGSCLGLSGWDDDDVDYSDDGVSEKQWKGGSFAAALESQNDDIDYPCEEADESWEEAFDDEADDEGWHPQVDFAVPVESVSYGICCACGEETDTTRNFVLMERLAPVKGAGWGCNSCGLSPDGAISVVCDKFLEDEQPIVLVVHGDYRENKRIPYHQLEPGRFEHDTSKHPQEVKPMQLPSAHEFYAAFKKLSQDKQPVVISMLNAQGWQILTAIQLVASNSSVKDNAIVETAVNVGKQIERLIVGDSPRFALAIKAGWERTEVPVPVEELIAVMKERGNTSVELTLAKIEAWSLILVIQMASRHPEYAGSTHMSFLHGMATNLEETLDLDSTLAAVTRAGWDTSYDQPV